MLDGKHLYACKGGTAFYEKRGYFLYKFMCRPLLKGPIKFLIFFKSFTYLKIRTKCVKNMVSLFFIYIDEIFT